MQFVQCADRGNGSSSQTAVREGERKATSSHKEGGDSQPFRIARLPLGYTPPSPDLPAPNTNTNNQSLLMQLAATIAKAVTDAELGCSHFRYGYGSLELGTHILIRKTDGLCGLGQSHSEATIVGTEAVESLPGPGC